MADPTGPVRRPALFLDRDGVINEDTGYVFRPEGFHFVEGVFEACRRFRDAGYEIVVVTNQSGIGRGYYSETAFDRLTGWMLDRFRDEGVEILDVLYCPHHPTSGVGPYRVDCDCRKPAPGMLLEAIRRHGLTPELSVALGDKPRDLEAGRAAGVGRCVLVGPLPEAEYSSLAAFADTFLD